MLGIVRLAICGRTLPIIVQTCIDTTAKKCCGCGFKFDQLLVIFSPTAVFSRLPPQGVIHEVHTLCTAYDHSIVCTTVNTCNVWLPVGVSFRVHDGLSVYVLGLSSACVCSRVIVFFLSSLVPTKWCCTLSLAFNRNEYCVSLGCL